MATVEVQAVSAGRGVDWVGAGFDLFKKAPGVWIGTLLIWLVLLIVVGRVPIIGSLATTLVGPVFQAGWMLACKTLDEGGSFKVEHLFAGFSSGRVGQLVMIGLLYLVGFLILGLVAGGTVFATIASGAQGSEFHIGVGMLLAILLGVSIGFLLAMAGYFAPALVMLRNVTAVEAMKLSFAGCMRNMWPFLFYGLLVILLSVIAAIPFGLGLLVAMPVMIASGYAAYKDIFPPSAETVTA